MSEIKDYMHFFMDTPLYLINQKNAKAKEEKEVFEKPLPSENEGQTNDSHSANAHKKINGKGGFKKQILIVSADKITTDTETFLMKILGSVNITDADILLTDDSIDLENINKYAINAPRFVFFFSNTTEFTGSMYQFIPKNNAKMMLCQPLQVLEKDTAAKKQLWGILKQTNF